MNYKCYRCHKELKDGETKCVHCGAIKIKVPKKEDINRNEDVVIEDYICNSKYAPYIVAFLIISNISFIVLACVNYTNTNLLFLFIGLALVSILFGYMYFQNNKWMKFVAITEAYTVFILLFICYLLFKRLVKKITGKNIERGEL